MMFSYVRLKHFLSFGEILFDFHNTSTSAKNFAAIYGENGSGKSNFVRSIELLFRSLTTFGQSKHAEEIARILKNQAVYNRAEIFDFLISQNGNKNLFSDYRMFDCTEPTEAEFGFFLNGYEGFYTLSFTDSVLSESLYYFTGKQRGYLFDIRLDENGTIQTKFNGGLFASSKIKSEMVDSIQQYWGKHTFLAILFNQMSEKNESYMHQALSPHLLDVIRMFTNISVISKKSHTLQSAIVSGKPYGVLEELQVGTIPADQRPLLERTERILRNFFTQTYADIKDVAYEIKPIENNQLHYRLYADKMIAGKVRRIDFQNESAGTQQVLDIIRTLLGLFCGVTVVFDEIDNGIHDVLLNQILTSIIPEINGQLIITTHNTMLLEEIAPQSVFLIQVDYLGNKEVHCATDFPIHSNNNLRTKYLKGLLGGTPYVDGVDYDYIAQEVLSGEAN